MGKLMWILVVWDHESQSWILAESLAAWQPVQEEGGERKWRPRHSARMGRRALAWSLQTEPWVGGTGAVLKPAGATMVPLSPPTHLGTTYSYKQQWLLMQTAHHLREYPTKCLVGRRATFTGIFLRSFQSFLQTSQFLLNSPVGFWHPSIFLNPPCIYLYLQPVYILSPCFILFLTSLSLFIDQGLVKKSLLAFCMPSWTF